MSTPSKDPLSQVETNCGSLLYELKVLINPCIFIASENIIEFLICFACLFVSVLKTGGK